MNLTAVSGASNTFVFNVLPNSTLVNISVSLVGNVTGDEVHSLLLFGCLASRLCIAVDDALNGLIASNVISVQYDIVPPNVSAVTTMSGVVNLTAVAPIFLTFSKPILGTVGEEDFLVVNANVTEFAIVSGCFSML